MIIDDNVFGSQEITDPLILKIIETPEMQNLKGRGAYGTYHVISGFRATNKFDHSIGVYILLRKLGAPFEEQVAGLIHDINHAAFAHVIDYMHGRETEQDHGDNIQNEIIDSSEIKDILIEKKIDSHKITDKKNTPLLEQDIPEICADRLEYILRDGLYFQRLTQKDVRMILDAVTVHQSRIVFMSKEAAELVAKTFLVMASHVYATPWQAGSYKTLADAIRIALEKGILKNEDMIASDELVFHILQDSDDEDILDRIRLIAPGTFKAVPQATQDSFFVKTKFRYVDPLYLEEGRLIRVFETNPGLRQEMEESKKVICSGYNLEIVKDLSNTAVKRRI